MKDPYQTPNAKLENDSLDVKPSGKFWKFFFWFLLILQLWGTRMMIIDEDPLIELLISSFIYVFVLIGLFGFAYKKKIFDRIVWRLTIPAALIYDVYSVVAVDTSGIEGDDFIFFSLLSFAILAPISFVQYLGLFKYAYRAFDIWQR